MKRPHRILLVEDDPLVRSSLHRTLRYEAYDVHVAASAVEALQLMNEAPVDAVVTDWRMPEVTGLQLLETVAATDDRVLRVLLCAEESAPEVLESVASGLVHHTIVKPWRNAALRRALAELLETVPSP